MIWETIAKLAEKWIPSPKDRLEFEQMIRAAENEYEKTLTERIEAVNTTMQAEAKSDSWMQKSWRPFIGLTFAAVLINNFILLPYFAQYGLQPIVLPDAYWTASLVILGAAAATRGWEKSEREKARNGHGGGESTQMPPARPKAPQIYRNSVPLSENPHPERGLEPGNRVSEGPRTLGREIER